MSSAGGGSGRVSPEQSDRIAEISHSPGLAHRKLDYELKQVIEFPQPLKPQLESAVVEWTFNWYWLVHGLRVATRESQKQLRENAERCAFDLITSLNPKAWNGR